MYVFIKIWFPRLLVSVIFPHPVQRYIYFVKYFKIVKLRNFWITSIIIIFLWKLASCNRIAVFDQLIVNNNLSNRFSLWFEIKSRAYWLNIPVNKVNKLLTENIGSSDGPSVTLFYEFLLAFLYEWFFIRYENERTEPFPLNRECFR